MSQRANIFLAVLILAVIALAVGVYVSGTAQKAPGSPDAQANNSTASPAFNLTDAALKLVLNDSSVQWTLSQPDRCYHVLSIGSPNSTHKSFLNYSGNLTAVLLDTETTTGLGPYHYYYIVDAEKGKVLDGAGWIDLPPADSVLLPPGAAWYDLTGITKDGWIAGTHEFINVSYSPADAGVYALIVTKEGLDALKNASGRAPLEGVDVSAYEYVDNGTHSGIMLPGSPWRLNASSSGAMSVDWSAVDPDTLYYLVLVNTDTSHDVSLTVDGSLAALPYLY